MTTMAGRREPYTERGIGRVPCVKCGAPAAHQWRICCSGWSAVCLPCDLAINRMVASWAFGEATAARLIERYERTQAHG